MANPLRAGVGRTIINPPLGIKTVGFTSREGVVEAIESDLTPQPWFSPTKTPGWPSSRLICASRHWKLVRDWRRQVAQAIGTVEANC